jgi:hypothetical protein
MCAIGRALTKVSSPQNANTPMKTILLPSVYWHNYPKAKQLLELQPMEILQIFFKKYLQFVAGCIIVVW